MITKPMLAASVDELSELRLPLIASPKIDGIRALKLGGKLLSRTFKAIPNVYIRETLEELLADGMDGEISAGKTFQDVSSSVMSRDGKPDFRFCLFDYVKTDLARPYEARLEDINQWWKKRAKTHEKFIEVLPTTAIHSLTELAGFEDLCLENGFEGVMLRLPNGPYKCGRSTFKEHYLLKVKQFETAEAEIIGFTEMRHNGNPQKENEVGHAKRSSHKANMVPLDTLGTFIVRDVKTGVEFEIGTGDGLTQVLRKKIWDKRKKHLGKIVHYKHQPHGAKDKPRLPVFLGFRDKRDM